jgi:hypothetical protein
MREAVCRVLVFNLAQSPEREVHGRFLEELKELTERRGAPACLLVVLEESGYKKRMGEADETADRVAARRRAWQRLCEESGVIAVGLDLEESPEERSLAHLRAALWPRATAARPVPVSAR